MESSLGWGNAENAKTHKELNLGVIQMAETLMPSKKLLGRFAEVQVTGVNCLGVCIESFGCLLNVSEAIPCADRDVVFGTDEGLDRSASRVSPNT